MITTSSIVEDIVFAKMPGEDFFTSSLQKELCFYLNNKVVKQGKLILFKRSHFFIQITLLNSKKERENFEIPFPFNVETYPEESMMYFDYRLVALEVDNLPVIKNKVSSSYFNKILEIAVKVN